MNLREPKDDEKARCPHCEKDVEEIVAREFDGGWVSGSRKVLYSCPHCRKVLGIGHS